MTLTNEYDDCSKTRPLHPAMHQITCPPRHRGSRPIIRKHSNQGPQILQLMASEAAEYEALPQRTSIRSKRRKKDDQAAAAASAPAPAPAPQQQQQPEPEGQQQEQQQEPEEQQQDLKQQQEKQRQEDPEQQQQHEEPPEVPKQPPQREQKQQQEQQQQQQQQERHGDMPAYRSAAVGQHKFEYLDHTADVQLHAWGATLQEAFENAGLALFNYMTPIDELQLDEACTRQVCVSGHDLQSLLFNFLDELLFVYSTEYIMLKSIAITHLDTDACSITATGRGEKFDRRRHECGTEVKAITFSAMQIRQAPGDAEVFVIVDI